MKGKSEAPRLNVDLVKKLILMQPNNQASHIGSQRITQEALEATTKLIHSFILEARRRASIEAECESATNHIVKDFKDDDNSQQSNSLSLQEKNDHEISAHHICLIAAELLMDFS